MIKKKKKKASKSIRGDSWLVISISQEFNEPEEVFAPSPC